MLFLINTKKLSLGIIFSKRCLNYNDLLPVGWIYLPYDTYYERITNLRFRFLISDNYSFWVIVVNDIYRHIRWNRFYDSGDHKRVIMDENLESNYKVGMLRSFDSDSERSELPIDSTPPTPTSAPIILNRRL